MSTQKPRTLLRIEYEIAAEEFLKSLPLEHFLEAAAQGTQRKITLESLDLVHARRPDVQVFNELLVQCPRRGPRNIGQVVPDNIVVVWPEPIRVSGVTICPCSRSAPCGCWSTSPSITIARITKKTCRNMSAI
jgi:hypothetical protein